jgi:hypothetical protein
MICKPCRDRHHHECRGGSWCDCQHGQYGSTLTTQQRNDLAVYGTVLPSIPITVTQQAGNGQAG